MNADAGKDRSLGIIMLGTGDFALPTFRALYDSSHEVLALYTQPDRLAPGNRPVPISQIKQVALERQTPVFQPEKINTADVLDQLQAWKADLFLVAAYGQILSPALLQIPRLATINVHASLLPKYRGASPIVHAIWNGDAETGVSIIQVLPQLDAGPVLGTVTTPIGPEETAGELEERLANLAPPLTLRVIDELAAGKTIEGIPQDPALVTRAGKLKKTTGEIDWSKSSRQLDWHVRAMQPWPNAYTFATVAGKPPVRLQVLKIRPVTEFSAGRSPGQVLAVDKRGLIVATGDGAVEIVLLQPDGKRAMPSADFLRGFPLAPGDTLGKLA